MHCYPSHSYFTAVKSLELRLGEPREHLTAIDLDIYIHTHTLIHTDIHILNTHTTTYITYSASSPSNAT